MQQTKISETRFLSVEDIIPLLHPLGNILRLTLKTPASPLSNCLRSYPKPWITDLDHPLTIYWKSNFDNLAIPHCGEDIAAVD